MTQAVNLLLRKRVIVSAIALLTGIAACDADQTPTAPAPKASLNAAAAASQPFYYYQGTKIALAQDPTRIVVSSSLSTGGAVRAAAAEFGLAVTEAQPLASAKHHWILAVTGTPNATAAQARLRMQRDTRFSFVSPVYKTLVGGSDVIPLNRIVVHFKRGVTRQEVDSLALADGLQVLRPPRPDSGLTEYWLSYPSDISADPIRTAATLAANPLVEWTDPDKVSDRKIQSVPNDPYLYAQWHIYNSTYSLNGVRVDDDVEPAWDLTTGSSSIRVAIVDDGVDVTQPDIVSAWAGAQGYDLFYGNGYPDDALHPFSNDAHGTSAAGIIAATQNNGVGVSGIAPGVTINVVRIFRHTAPSYPGDQGTTQVASDAQIADGLTWAYYTAHSDVISNSWGEGSPSNAITNAITNATTQGRNGLGTVVVFSAGNSSNRSAGQVGAVVYPGSLSTSTSVVTVGAIGPTGAPADYTPDGSAITLVAPSSQYGGTCAGGGIVTTDRTGSSGCNDGPSGDANYTASFTGTSAAAPQVAAVAALILSREPTTLTSTGVRSRLTYGSVPWGTSTTYGAGKLDAYRSLMQAFSVTISGPGSLIDAPGVYTWTANVAGGDGNYTYAWQESFDGGNTFYTVGSGNSYSEDEESDTQFYLRVLVSDNGFQTSDTILETVSLGGGCSSRGC